MSMILYDFAMAPSPRRARIALMEKGISYETVSINLLEGEQLSDEFKAINPTCTIPALKLPDGNVLGDNHGIIAWLDREYPEPPLLGRSAIEAAHVATWSSRCEFEGLLAIAEILRNFAPQMKGRAVTGPVNHEQIPELADRGRSRLGHFWETLDERLEGRKFLATETFSWADITGLVAVDFSAIVGQSPDEKFKNIWQWRNALNELESVSGSNP